MSAVYDEVKRKALLQQRSGFATMYGSPSDVSSGGLENSASSVAGAVGSAFITAGAVLYALQSGGEGVQDRASVWPVHVGQAYPLLGDRHASTMSLGSQWVGEEVQLYDAGIVTLPWSRKVIHSGEVLFRASELPRRIPTTWIGDLSSDERDD